MKQFIKILKDENPIFVLMLGLCSALAITTKVENAYLMGLCVLIVLLFSEIVITLMKKIVPKSVKIPVYIVIVGTFVTIVEVILKTYIPAIYDIFNIYLPLIIVNCIVLGRLLQITEKTTLKTSIIDSLGIGISYAFSLILIALFREVLGNNTITLMDSISSITGYKAVYQVFPDNMLFPMSFLVSPAGAFIVVGILMALFQKLGGNKHESN